MSDLIDRQEAIDAIEPWLNVKGYSEGEMNMLKAVLYELRMIPSAQPEIIACGQGELVQDGSRLVQDVISRQAAIDALMEKDKKLRNINWYDKPYAEGECRGIDEALSIISNLQSAQPEPRWIPVTERLPEAGIRYQVTFESGEVGYADFRNKIFSWDGSAKENVWEIDRYYEDDGEVIAWMPLPESYRKETDDAIH